MDDLDEKIKSLNVGVGVSLVEYIHLLNLKRERFHLIRAVMCFLKIFGIYFKL